MDMLIEIGRKAKSASKIVSKIKTLEKNKILLEIADSIEQNFSLIKEYNDIDLKFAKENNLKESFIDRLTINEKRLIEIRDMFIQIASLDDPIGEFITMETMANNLVIGNKRVPLGVIGIIYESRPNVTADAFALCFKASNAVILRGGKEAINTNKILVKIFKDVLIKNNFDENIVQLIEDLDRDVTKKFMKLHEYVDVLIPRGGRELIQTVVLNSTIPVIETGVGNCHIFVDESADFNMAIDIILNAKIQRPGVCNSCESLLVHKNIANTFIPIIIKVLQDNNVLVKAHQNVFEVYDDGVEIASEDDFYKEFTDLILTIKIVSNTIDAINHISKYSSHHSETIITDSYKNGQQFLDEVDSAAVYVNASTRFTDGYEFGFGSEIGISTQKLHVRGPMGLKSLTSNKYIIYGEGQIRE